ncbi:MAG: glycosyltransferase family 2 protein [Desulfobacca sp.]|nr:glycosyltransferase family 2 protein [Desulfobacca sp.]
MAASPSNAVYWEQGLPPRLDQKCRNLDLILKLSVILGLLVSLVVAVHIGSLDAFLNFFRYQTYARPLLGIGAAYTLAFLVLQLVNTVLWWRYKPYPLPSGPLPRLTVIIPAYNEGPMVEKAIYSVANADYPADRLEIICIDDGSRDDTWFYMARAQKRFPDLIKTIRFPRNQGKREAMYAAFTQGQGEFFVTVDSDSVITPETLKQIIAPLLQNPKIGAVAGNVKVYNRHHNFMTRMLWVRFVLSFDFLRASQSMYGGVFCTPGALSAYRREAVLPIINDWRHQTFWGVLCTIGEDRAFTNYVLRQGYYTAYQRTAQVYTLVPETYRGLCKMFLRWDRSNFRESYVQMQYIFTRYRDQHRLLPILDFLVRGLNFPIRYLFLPLLVASFVMYPIILLKFFTAMGVITLVLTTYYIQQERDLDFVYGILYSYYAFFFSNGSRFTPFSRCATAAG